MAYAARILADSVTETGVRLTTMEVTFPRIVLAEFNTHRVFSRNSASSRAIPFEKQVRSIRCDPFIPHYWGANQAGMQASQELDDQERQRAYATWMQACDNAIDSARRLHELGVHKQLVNRMLEPYMWQTVIVSATEWHNFFALRDNEMAQPEIQKIAHMMHELYDAGSPALVPTGGWHLPLIQPEEYDGTFERSEAARKISAARCARVSYLTHDGKRDLEADLKLYERLVGGGHMSPLEHVATPHPYQYRTVTTQRTDHGRVRVRSTDRVPVNTDLGNFRGWKQLRKFVPNEHDFSLVEKSEE